MSNHQKVILLMILVYVKVLSLLCKVPDWSQLPLTLYPYSLLK